MRSAQFDVMVRFAFKKPAFHNIGPVMGRAKEPAEERRATAPPRCVINLQEMHSQLVRQCLQYGFSKGTVARMF